MNEKISREEELKKWEKEREEARQLLRASEYQKKPKRDFWGIPLSIIRASIMQLGFTFADGWLRHRCPGCNAKLHSRVVEKLGCATAGVYTILICPCGYQYVFETSWLVG